MFYVGVFYLRFLVRVSSEGKVFRQMACWAMFLRGVLIVS